jgi:hypothetical protein
MRNNEMYIVPRFSLEIGEEKRVRFVPPLKDELVAIVQKSENSKPQEVFGVPLWVYENKEFGMVGEFQLLISGTSIKWETLGLLRNVIFFHEVADRYPQDQAIIGRRIGAYRKNPYYLTKPLAPSTDTKVVLLSKEEIQHSFDYHIERIWEWHIPISVDNNSYR